MTVKLSELRVVAGMDASKYVAGMNQKVAADKAGAASSAQVGAAVAATDSKLSTAGDLLARLERQYVSGAREAQMFGRGLNALSRGIETGNIPMVRAESILEGMYRKYGMTANAAEIMARGQTSLATVVESVNGRLNAQQAEAAATAATMNRLAAANQNVMGGQRFNTANIAAQFQDIGVTAAMGMNPLLIAMQQGTQISAVLAQMESPVRGLGEAFLSVISPASLLTIGIVALGAAGLQMIDWSKLGAAALTGLASVLETIAPYAVMAAAGLALLYAPAILGGLGATAGALLTIARAAGAVALAFAVANPGAAFVLGLVAVVAAANVFRDELTRIFGVDIVGAVKTGVNFIIGAFFAAYEDIRFVWRNFPDIMGAAAVGAGNALIAGIEGAINILIPKIKAFYRMLNPIAGLADMIGGGVGDVFGTGMIPDSVSFGRLENSFAGNLSAPLDERNRAVAAAMDRDYLGEFGGAIVNGASAASAKLKELAADLTKVDDKTKKGGGKTDRNKFDDIVADADRRIAAMRAEQQGFGQSEEAAARMRYEQDLLNKATQAGITLDQTQIGILKAKAAEMAATEAATRRMKREQEAAKEAASGFGGVLRGLIDGTTSWKDALLQMIPILLKLLNTMAGGSLFGGGIFQSFLGGLMGIAWAKGGAFENGNVIPFAQGGVVSGPTVFPMAKGAVGLMGEAGPEAIMPLRRGSDGSLGVRMFGGGFNGLSSGSGTMTHHVEVTGTFVDDGGVVKGIARGESAKAAGALAKRVPSMAVGAVEEGKFRRLRPQGALG